MIVMLNQTYKTILVGIDGSDQSFLAYEKALAVANRNNGTVVAAHIIENKDYSMLGYSTLNDNLLDQEAAEAQDFMRDCEKRAEEAGFTQLETVVTYGQAKEVMCNELPKKYDVDLIMVGQSGLNTIERLMLGSVSSYIIRHAPCDVLVVHPEEEQE